jgi:hypothetical protein
MSLARKDGTICSDSTLYNHPTGAMIDFWFSADRDATAAKRFFQKALQAPGHPRARVITVDGNPMPLSFSGADLYLKH